MLNLSDADLAKLRLECWVAIQNVVHAEQRSVSGTEIAKDALTLAAWCLRDREPQSE